MQPTFKIGDKAVYPAQGVTEIMGIESMEIAGMQQNFYVLRVLDTDKKIRIPIDYTMVANKISNDKMCQPVCLNYYDEHFDTNDQMKLKKT